MVAVMQFVRFEGLKLVRFEKTREEAIQHLFDKYSYEKDVTPEQWFESGFGAAGLFEIKETKSF